VDWENDMAGDWIKLQKDTPEKPEVLAISSRLQLDPDAVVGKLVRIWSWFDTHTLNGNAESVTFAFLDRITGVTGFAEQMMLVGWLIQKGSVLTLPNFEYHNGQSAKKRALVNKRVEKYRNGNAESNSKSNASVTHEELPEKRREENINNTVTKVPCPQEVTPEVWKDWVALRNKNKSPVTQLVINGLNKQAKIAGMTLNDVLEICIIKGWRSFEASWIKPEDKPSKKPNFGGAI
jgi:hypothetical protein